VQTVQIGVGDVLRDINIPIYFLFQRLFTCPTVKAPLFSIQFEVNLMIMFENNYVVQESFPIRLFR
jgi:hypothetical protein